MAPASSSTWRTACVDGRIVGEVEGDRDDARGDVVRATGGAVDPVARGGEQLRGAAADAGGRAGDSPPHGHSP